MLRNALTIPTLAALVACGSSPAVPDGGAPQDSGVDAPKILPDAPSGDGSDASDAAAAPSALADVAAWASAKLPAYSTLSASQPLIVVIAAGTNNQIHTSDLQPAQTSSDPVGGGPDTKGRPFYQPLTSYFQAGQIAIAALLAGGYTPCQINSPLVRFVVWGFGNDTAGTDFYFRANEDIGTDLYLMHSLGGANSAIDGPTTGGGLAYTAVNMDKDAKALMAAIDSYAGSFAYPSVLLVGHSWGGAYVSYVLDHYYPIASTPAFDLVAGIEAAAPAKLPTWPGAFFPGACPPDTIQLVAGVLCATPTCLGSGEQRNYCSFGNHSGALRQVPGYTFHRPDDPVPSTDASTIAAAWSAWQGTYPGINGHDYMIRTNGSYDVQSAYWWDTGWSTTCDTNNLVAGDFVVGAGAMTYLGEWGIDTLQLSCAIDYSTNFHYEGACSDGNQTRSSMAVSQDSACGSVVPGQQAAVCITSSSPNRCYVTGTSNGSPYATPATVHNRRGEAGFLVCPSF